ncbi:S4 domain-containing protein [Oleiagrimonas sp. C23AA]|uniref:RNA-binding S4 domain-containing protein n=1 Tax=Oleiagrimonas sp. C23AA TaxID=2719047 RepID=UPI00141FA1BB|nr:S4 domain-containing protein [Oleiagrimonas sp. C23AA]NII10272.1 RNA-binding protein [Oleiagrimonas sp. C23AA]
MSESQKQSIRADVWLWAARFFKTRSLCRQAIEGGKVELNGAHCKPSKGVQVGDTLRITRANERYEIAVTALSDKRGPAAVAQTLYAESEGSVKAREAAREMARLSRPVAPDTRPDKQARRELRRFKHGGEE